MSNLPVAAIYLKSNPLVPRDTHSNLTHIIAKGWVIIFYFLLIRTEHDQICRPFRL
jgi:hypothetical protein